MTQEKKAIMIKDPTLLPKACYSSMFLGTKIAYLGKALSSRIVQGKGGKLMRAIEVGDYLYVAQDLYKDSKWASLARAGHKILWVVHRPSATVVGKVVDGKVTRL